MNLKHNRMRWWLGSLVFYAYLHHWLKESVSFWVEYFGFRSVRSLHTSGTCTETVRKLTAFKCLY